MFPLVETPRWMPICIMQDVCTCFRFLVSFSSCPLPSGLTSRIDGGQRTGELWFIPIVLRIDRIILGGFSARFVQLKMFPVRHGSSRFLNFIIIFLALSLSSSSSSSFRILWRFGQNLGRFSGTYLANFGTLSRLCRVIGCSSQLTGTGDELKGTLLPSATLRSWYHAST